MTAASNSVASDWLWPQKIIEQSLSILKYCWP
jgi:hypothetical protein